MAKEISSSSSSKGVDERNLLKFYQRKCEEFQKKEDKFKEKVNKHLANLVDDRHELQEEVLRRGEKIADLQKAVVELQLSVFEEKEGFLKLSTENEELKRNKEKLHSDIQALLAMTNQEDLRDKIIYILQDPTVNIAYQSDIALKPKSEGKVAVSQKLENELNCLRKQIEEVIMLSNGKSNVVLEDCKQALERSKEKIMQDEIQIRQLQKKLEGLEIQEQCKSSAAKTPVPVTSSEEILADNSMHLDAEVFTKICSHLKDMHLSLVLLMKIVSKVKNILNEIQATKLYQRTVKIPKEPSSVQHFVEENTILQLESCLRQCTRLTFDVNNMYKSLCKYVSNNRKIIQNIGILKSELKHLEGMLKEMAVVTADNDLLNVGLQRSNFFQALRDSSIAISEEDKVHHINDFRKIISNNDILKNSVTKATDFIVSVIEKYNVTRHFRDIADSLRDYSPLSVKSQSTNLRDRTASKSDYELRKAKSHSSKELDKLLGIYKCAVHEAENLGFSQAVETKLLPAKLQPRVQEEKELEQCDEDIIKADVTEIKHSDNEEILNRINETLSRVRLIEESTYSKDERMCQKLAESLHLLKVNFSELSQHFNLRSVQKQFSEYSSITLSKLGELAKQCRNSVIAAEAQIAAQRSNAKHLAEKLKGTEDLLRESIDECLSLKQKVKKGEEQHELDKYSMVSDLKDKLERSGSHDVDDIIDELASNIDVYKGLKAEAFVCMYCKQGTQMGHKLCQERIKELTSESRKFKTQMKLLQKETNEERMTLRQYREIAEKSCEDLTKRNNDLVETLQDLKKRNCSLLENLKVEKSRLKGMERFRRLEIEGFQTDIKQLKGKIRELEKQLMKAVLVFENNQKDMELLKVVHETAQRSKQATAALKRLKAKLYELENDIKSL